MGKKKKISTDGGDALSHNPFAALGGLEHVPDGPERPEQAKQPPPEPTSVEAPSIPGKLVCRRQRKGHGGKTVTIVEGLASDQLETLAKQARKALGRGARVEGEELVIAGAQHQQVADWLTRQGASKVVLGN